MNWWNRLRGRSELEEQLEKELRFHLDQYTSDLVARGCDPEQARRKARLALGGTEQVKEHCRDARGTRWVEELWQDLRYALRTMHQRPGFAAVALLTLALGTGATTVMFSLVNGVLLKPLAYREPDRLVRVHGYAETWNVGLFGQQNLAHFDFLDCRRDSRSLDMAGWVYAGGTLSEPEPAEYIDTFEASSNLFSVMDLPLFRGRAFRPEEDRPGGARVAILGYSFWQRRYGGNPSAIGTEVVFGGKRYTVVGIAPGSFQLGGDEADLYTPMGQDVAPFMQGRDAHPVTVIARLRPGIKLRQAQTELSLMGRHLADQYPKSNKGRTFVAEPLRPNVGNAKSTLWLLLGAVILVLLIACMNIASLLLARAVSRQRELAMRAALGASRSRLARQCLTKSVLLGLAGGALGVLIAAFGTRPFVALWPGSLPRAQEVQLEWHVLGFAFAVSLVSGLLFGMAPALRGSVRDLEQALRAGSRTVVASSRRLHSGFVIAEIALAVVLLVSAGTLGRTLLHLSSLNPGLDIRNVLTARMALSADTLRTPARIRAAWRDVLNRARVVPGVQTAAIVDTVPMREGNNPIPYSTSPAARPENERPFALATCVTPDYLQVMRISLRQGRFLNEHDRLGSEGVVVIDDVMAQQAFGEQNPIGNHIWIDLGSDPVRVVGVVGHVRYWGPAGDDQSPVRSQLYYPLDQVPDQLLRRWSELMSIAVRTTRPPLSVVEPLRRELRGATRDQVLYEVHTMEQLAGASLARHRFLLLLFAIFAAFALLLACIGIYGVLAYLTNQRVPEFGVRMALGATAHDVLELVLRESVGMILIGVGVGTLAAFSSGYALRRLVEGIQPVGPSSFGIMVPVLIAAALFASFLPARRASRVDPMAALRQE